MKRTIPLFIIGFLFCFLLLFPRETLESSQTGILLWFNSLLPTLLPFLIVSQLLLKTSLVDSFLKILSPAFRRIFHCSDNGIFCMICGFLCGYPVGARLIALQIQDGKLTLREGQYLLSFCNNVSPVFCISYGILYGIGSTKTFAYLFSIYGSALIFGILTRPKQAFPLCGDAKKQTSSTETIFQLIDVCIIDSFFILIKLCGYLVLFSILSSAILWISPDCPDILRIALTSLLEITKGLSLISTLPAGSLRSFLGVFALSFGGLCCLMQTHSVISGTGLSLQRYFFHKLLISVLSLLLFFLWSFLFSVNSWSQLLTVFGNHFIITV